MMSAMPIKPRGSPLYRPKKRLGQNFLHDPGVIGRLLAVIDPRPQDHLVEIGPGRGALTRGLLTAARRLDVVELDRDLLEPLRRGLARDGELHIHHADALTFELCRLRDGATLLRLVGNLPYNISTPLLFRFLDQAHCIQDMHLMLQREVAERVAALPGSKTYGRLSVMVQAYCAVETLLSIGAGAFVPAPKVESAFLRLVPYRPLPQPIRDQARLAQIVAAAFSQRRKTLRNTLKGMMPVERLAECGIDPGWRAEELSVGAFIDLANAACNA